MGAIGLPVGALAVALAAIPLVGLYVFWLPGAGALTLGVIGVRRFRDLPGGGTLSAIALALGALSFAISGGWLLLALIFRTFAECMDVSVCG